MRTRQPSIISDEQCSHATLMSIFHPRKTDRMLRVPSHPFPFIVHTHACMNSIMSGKSQSTRDVFLSPLCKWIWKGRKWTFSWHRYAGLIVPQMSVQVMRKVELAHTWQQRASRWIFGLVQRKQTGSGAALGRNTVLGVKQGATGEQKGAESRSWDMRWFVWLLNLWQNPSSPLASFFLHG